MVKLEEIPLRERKSARIKLALLDAALERMLKRPFAEITVKELCEAVEISEVTFFNYFHAKNELLRYYLRLWSVEVFWRAAMFYFLPARKFLYSSNNPPGLSIRSNWGRKTPPAAILLPPMDVCLSPRPKSSSSSPTRTP